MSLSTLAEQTQFGELPLDFVALVFLRLPLDARLELRSTASSTRGDAIFSGLLADVHVAYPDDVTPSFCSKVQPTLRKCWDVIGRVL